MVATVWQCVCVVFILWISLREVLNCGSTYLNNACLSVVHQMLSVGRDVQEIAENLKGVEDWEGLAGWLNISSGDINTIIENCDRPNTRAQCCRRELVRTYCYQRGGDPERVKEDIRRVLESEIKQG